MKLHFRSTLLGFLLTVFIAALFTGLGRWQLERAAEKTKIIETHQRRAERPAVALPARLDDAARWRHRQVHVTAVPLPKRQFLLDNQVRDGRPGFNVLTPFRPLNGTQGAGNADGDLIIVDRGWVPLGASRDDLPDLSIPEIPMRLEGVIYVPYDEPFSLGGMDDGELDWPRVIQFLDFEVLGRRLQAPLRPFTLRMNPALAHGYRRDWRLTSISPNKHLAYAFQWFALALATGAVFVVLTLRRRKR